MTTPDSPFYEQPILNSPYEEPTRHHSLDAEGQPLNEPPRDGRRKSELITPVPKPRKKKRRNASQDQGNLNLQNDDGLSTEEQEYNPTPIINEIRIHVGEWRRSNPAAWGVTPATARLLTYWRGHQFQGVRPFFCQVEAAETVIWLTEVARTKRQYAHISEHILGANEQANPELLRLAMKMATGAGKTTVMAMLIAWAGGQRDSLPHQHQLLTRLSCYRAGHHDQRSPACLAAQRHRKLLPHPRTRSR